MERYKYTEKELKEILSSIVILVDTREKNNDHILSWLDKNKIKYAKKKLDFADYSFMIPKNPDLNIDRDMYFTNEVTVERKNSVDELAANFSQDRDRIKNEFIQHNGNMTLLIEDSSYKDMCEGNYRSKYDPKSYVGTMFSFSERFDIPFIFIPKEYTAHFIYFKFYYYLRNILK